MGPGKWQDRSSSSFGGVGGQAVTELHIDYVTVFQDLPIPVVLLTPEFVIADMNMAYLQVAGRTREELLGRDVFDAFPDNPSDPSANGVHELRASLERVVATGTPDALSMQQYDVELPDRPGEFAVRYWCPVNAPVFGPDGDVVLIVQCVEEITNRVQKFISGLVAGDARDA
jgi:PAS domain-containing protein